MTPIPRPFTSPPAISLVARAGAHTIADSLDTPRQFTIRAGRKFGPTGEPTAGHPNLAPRTYGDGQPGATTMLRAGYDLHGEASRRLLDLLPPVAVIPAGPRTVATLDLLSHEVASEEPGQDAVLNRVLDLLLVLGLRAWCANSTALPAWYRALGDPAIGEALRLIHTNPAHRWTVGELASKAGLSRATFAARFRTLVGEPPLTYLAGWRLTLGADLLRDSTKSIASVACAVGYSDSFAFSTAFKRARGVSPSVWRLGRV